MQNQALYLDDVRAGVPRVMRASSLAGIPERLREPGAVHFILNPTAGGGRASRLRATLNRGVERRFGAGVTRFVTTAPGEATLSTREAIERGALLVLVAGGDGTIQEAVNGYFAGGRPLNPACELGVLNCGTGRGLADSVGLAETMEEQLERIVTAPVRLLDVGRVRCMNGDDRAERLFVNECQGALGGAVVQAVGPGHKRLGGRLAFGLAAVSQLLRCHGAWLRVTLDGRTSLEGSFLALMVGNGEQCGGGMRLLPGARPDDGWLDVVLVDDLTVPQRLAAFPRIYRGLHTTLAQVRAFRCRSLTVEGASNVPLEADGELLGGLPCEIDVLPRLLPLRGTGFPGTARAAWRS